MSLNGLCVKNRSLPNVLIAQSALRGEHIDKYHSKVRGKGVRPSMLLWIGVSGRDEGKLLILEDT